MIKKTSIISILLLVTHLPVQAVLQDISNPGPVELGGDISFAPSVADDVAIQISASNVTLDLANASIDQTNVTANASAIEILPNVSNITIQNGTIKNFTGTGIIVREGTSNITIQNVRMFDVQTVGIDVAGTAPSMVQGVIIENCQLTRTAQGTSGTSAVSIEQVQTFRFRNNVLNTTGVATHNTIGLRLANVSIGEVGNTTIVGTVGLSSCIGIDMSEVNNLNFSNVFVISNVATAPASSFIGYNLQDNTNCNFNLFESCSAFRNTANLNANSTGVGFQIGVGSQGVVLENCRATENEATGSVTGCLCNTIDECSFTRCICQFNVSTTDDALGFDLSSCTNCRIQNCTSSQQEASSGQAIGVRMTNCDSCFLGESFFFGNQGSNNNNSFGLVQSPNSPFGNNLFVQNVSLRNGTNITRQYDGLAPNQRTLITRQNVNNVNRPFTNIGAT